MFHFPLLLESHNDKRHGVDWGLETMSRIASLIQHIRNTPTHGWEFSLSSHKKQGRLTWVSMPRHGNPPRRAHFITYLTLFNIKNYQKEKFSSSGGVAPNGDEVGVIKKETYFIFTPTPPLRRGRQDRTIVIVESGAGLCFYVFLPTPASCFALCDPAARAGVVIFSTLSWDLSILVRRRWSSSANRIYCLNMRAQHAGYIYAPWPIRPSQ